MVNITQVKSHARVVAIGDGIAGCSTMYHRTREVWTDVVRVESALYDPENKHVKS